MIDWVTAELACLHWPIDAGRVLKISPNQDIEWETRCRASVTGSYESSISLKSVGGNGRGQATHILLSGNPSKFLQGHNVFGSDDLLALVSDTFNKV